MKIKSIKKETLAVSMLGVLGSASPVMASSVLNVLGVLQNNVDVYTFSCPPGMGFIGATARVADLNPIMPALMQVVVGKDGNPTVQRTAPNEGLSTFANTLDGPGTYAVAFKKSTVGVEAYRGDVFCIRASLPLNTLINPPGGVQLRINQ
jgi:hypothetical protein